MGAILGFLLVAVGLAALVQLGLQRRDTGLVAEATPGRELPQAWTATSTVVQPSSALARTSTPEQPDPYENRLASVAGEMEEGLRLVAAGEYPRAVVVWDQVLAIVPENPEAHYQRGLSYLGLLESQRYLEEYLLHVDRAIADLDVAIASSQDAPGDYYHARAEAYFALAGEQRYRVDSDYVEAIGLENLRIALRLGTSDPLDARDLPFALQRVGECDQAIEETEVLIAERGPGASPSGDLNQAHSLSYLCKGDFDRALAYNDVALSVHVTDARMLGRAYMLYFLGRLDEAMAIMNDLIEDEPFYGGNRYFFRALIAYDLGDREQARSDLEIGSTNTWQQADLKAYLASRFLLEAGRTEEAIAWLQLAEATLSRVYTPLLDRIHAELQTMGATPLSPTPSVDIPTTPIPTPIPTSS